MRKNDQDLPECADYGDVPPMLGSRPKPERNPQEVAQLKKAVQLFRSGELTSTEIRWHTISEIGWYSLSEIGQQSLKRTVSVEAIFR